MKKNLFLFAFACLFMMAQDVLAVTYYTRSIGDWAGNIWGTTTTGAGSALPALVDGDVIYIDDDISITTNINIDANVTIVINATVTISGQLRVGAGSVFQFPSSSGRLVDGGGGNSAKIVIGNGDSEWSGNDQDLTGPGSFDDGWTCCTLTLPVKLLHFDVGMDEGGVLLKWATNMEENFNEFVIQRSTDGLQFTDIGAIPGKGFNIHDIVSRYSFKDVNPMNGLNYYRLKAVDLDERFELFGVKAVKVVAPNNLAVYPNPSGGESISLRTNFGVEESDRVVLIDPLGIVILNARAADVGTEVTFSERLRPGLYMLQYKSETHEQVIRLVVTH